MPDNRPTNERNTPPVGRLGSDEKLLLAGLLLLVIIIGGWLLSL